MSSATVALPRPAHAQIAVTKALIADPRVETIARLARRALLVVGCTPKSWPCLVSPSGPEWLHEVKHDGWRAQLHRHEGGATILSKSGKDISGRFAVIGSALRGLPPCVIDAEIVGCDTDSPRNDLAAARKRAVTLTSLSRRLVELPGDGFDATRVCDATL